MTSPRFRVISDNDYSGDPDGLAQLAHHALSPSIDLRLVIGTHLRVGDPFDPSGESADNAAAIALEILQLSGREDVPVLAGSNVDITTSPDPSAAAIAIVAEAMRDDTDARLFYCAGAGLTELAAALRLEPAIAARLTLVWIGGPEHEGLATAPPGAMPIEYNLLIDVPAATEVFDSAVPIWQIPRDAYRQTLASFTELRHRMGGAGPLGARLFEPLDRVREMVEAHGGNIGETYIMGDSPLVLVTALLSSFEADASSSGFVYLPTPGINAAGQYVSRPDARPLRVFTSLDTRLMFEDFYLKLAALAG
ncbi:MAG: Inosine-uridine preferring nucleoside hydrolase [Glaciihabitans sp.]|nr:Inosine-uridine preferring nucleoside hydrolase [Glaciihabitans sp.]